MTPPRVTTEATSTRRKAAGNVYAGTRLAADQLEALAPGDAVTIETATGQRPRLTTGTVVRTDPSDILVSIKGPRGGTFIERYGRRDGVRVGAGNRAELVNLDADDRAVEQVLRQRTREIDVLYRQWSRQRADVEALRELQAAIEDFLRQTAPTG